MAKKQINIVVDTMQNSYSTIGTFKEFDSVFFNATILENGIPKDLTGQTLKLYVKRADRTILEQTTGIKIIEATKGTITIDVKSGAFKGEGFSIFELNISDTTGSITTANFTSRTVKKLANDEIIENSNEIDLLKEVEIYVNLAKKEIKDFAKLQEQMLITNDTLNENEIEREKVFTANELSRENRFIENETNRVTAETNRETNEIARAEAEKVREKRFEEMEGSSQLSNITQEITEARVDYFGKEHATLKEKEDREFEFVHVDNSKGMFVEQSTTNGHMKIENSIEGRARDTIIKGRTLQNISTIKFPYTQAWGGGNGSSWMHTNMFQIPLLQEGKTYSILVTHKIKNFKEFSLSHPNGHSPSQITSSKTGEFVSFIAKNITSAGIGLVLTKSVSEVYTQEEKDSITMIIVPGDLTGVNPCEYFEGIKSLGEEENKISILSTGKNLWSNEDILVESQNNSIIEKTQLGFKLTRKLLVGDHFGASVTLKLKPNTQYTISLNKKFSKDQLKSSLYVYSDRLFGDRLSSGEEPLTFTTKTNGFIVIGFYYTGETWIINDFVEYDNIQLEENTTATPYEPYQEDKKDILLPVVGGCKGLPSGVADEILDNGDYLQKIDKIVFDGAENITRNIQNSNENFTVFHYVFNIKTNSVNLCNKLGFFTSGFWYNPTHEGMSNYTNGKEIVFVIANTKLESTDNIGFKKLLKQWYNEGNPLVVYYELTEPILHKAETPVNNNPSTFKTITHVSCLNKIAPSELKAKFPIDTAATFSRLNRENKNLEKENIELKNDLIEQAMHFKNEDLDLMASNLELDFRIMDIEFVLDTSINNSNKKYKLKGNDTMSPYTMMKKLILAGRYEKEDMEYKISVYLQRGRITEVEAQELRDLILANEIIS